MSDFERVRRVLLGIPAREIEPALHHEFPEAWTGRRAVPVLAMDDGQATFRPTDSGLCTAPASATASWLTWRR
jgi:hypothetical protein